MADPQTYADDVRAKAREWHTVMNAGDVSAPTRRAFEGWLHASKAHKRAYHDLEQMWRDLDYVAIEAGVDATVAEDVERPLAWRSRLEGVWRRPTLSAAIAASLTLMVVAVAIQFVGNEPDVIVQTPPQFETATGEIRTLALEDGSIVTLGAKSQLDTVFTDDTRQVVLLAGEAFFEVAKDETRPFYVAVDDTLIRVVGTKFDVKRTSRDVHVSVLEGVVDVLKTEDLALTAAEPRTPISTKRLVAGQKIVASPAPVLPDVQRVDQAMPGAWRAGRLAYEDASLAEIVFDVNRYSERTIRLAGSDIGDIRFTVAFQTDEIDQWLSVLEETQPVEIVDRGAGDILLRARR